MPSRYSECCTRCRNEPRNPLGPERGNDASSTTTPIIAREYRRPNAQPIHQGQEVVSESPLLTGTRSVRVAKAGRPKAPQIRHIRLAAYGVECRQHTVPCARVVGPSMEQNHW